MFPAARKQTADAMAPPRWKAVIASGLAIYPLILFIPDLVKSATAAAPHWLQSLATVSVITPIATFATLPAVNWLLQRWLYRDPKP